MFVYYKCFHEYKIIPNLRCLFDNLESRKRKYCSRKKVWKKSCIWDLKIRAVAKISSCWVYAVSRREIAQLGSPFGSIFLLFPVRVAKSSHSHSSRGKSGPLALSYSPEKSVQSLIKPLTLL